MKSIYIQKIYNKADSIDESICQNGLAPNIPKGISRFKFNVHIIHEEGTTFLYKNSYCLEYENYLLVFSEHHDVNIIHLDDLYEYSMTENIAIPKFSFYV